MIERNNVSSMMLDWMPIEQHIILKWLNFREYWGGGNTMVYKVFVEYPTRISLISGCVKTIVNY